MRILNWYKKTMLKFKAASVKNVFPTAKHTIVFAFTCGGRDYYEFDNADGDLPYQRGIDAIASYREFTMMCSFEYLQWHVDELGKLTTLPLNKINAQSIAKIEDLRLKLKQRLTFPFDPGLLYNLGAVVYFDKNEDPYSFDEKYAYEKIKFWKKNADVKGFFLQRHFLKLAPFLKHCEGNILLFTDTVEKINQQHLDEILSTKSKEQKEILKKQLSRLSLMGIIPE